MSSISFDQSVNQAKTSRSILAELLSKKSNTPEEALKAVFDGAMIATQTILKTQIDPDIKNRVWTYMSGKYLDSLNRT